MTPELAICERILQLSQVTAVIDQRVYSKIGPQGESRPFVRVTGVSSPIEQHLRGPQGQRKSRVQVDVMVASASGQDTGGIADSLVELIIGDGLGPNASGVFGWVGYLGGSPPEMQIQNVEVFGDGRPVYEPDEMRQVGKMIEFMVHWRALPVIGSP